MLTAITRSPSAAIGGCELTFLPRQQIDVPGAVRQHQGYDDCLAKLGARVISLPAEPELADAVFVEDAAIILDEIAVITRMGSAVREKETAGVTAALAPHRPIEVLTPPATLDGGDVMRVGRTLFVGISARTNRAGTGQLREIVEPLGYGVQTVEVKGCLHLKTGCSYLGRGTVLANSAWVDTSQLKDLTLISVPPAEPWAANTLTIGDTTLVAKCFPQTRRLLEEQGFRVRAVDMSELQKAEGGLTCLSIIFEHAY